MPTESDERKTLIKPANNSGSFHTLVCSPRINQLRKQKKELWIWLVDLRIFFLSFLKIHILVLWLFFVILPDLAICGYMAIFGCNFLFPTLKRFLVQSSCIWLWVPCWDCHEDANLSYISQNSESLVWFHSFPFPNVFTTSWLLGCQSCIRLLSTESLHEEFQSIQVWNWNWLGFCWCNTLRL